MTKNVKVFSVQPRFRYGDVPYGWSLVEGILRSGSDAPIYGTMQRDYYLSQIWQDEPMTAGVFSTWIEKAQTVNWKVVAGKNTANYYALLFNNCDGGEGWTYHEGAMAQDFLTTDKGCFEELGRNIPIEVLNKLHESTGIYTITGAHNQARPLDYEHMQDLLTRATFGKVTGIQHLDSTRMVRYGLPGMRWRYYPEWYDPSSIPNDNLIQITSMQTPRDRYRGLGLCALSRILTAKQLMLGYLTYFRQEIGDLPPELVAIINGLPQTAIEDSLTKYKAEKEQKGLDTYGKIWWLGSDDPATPISFDIKSLTAPNKSFSYPAMTEWFAKVLSLNVGEDVGEFWLLQRGESKTVQGIQALKSKGKGVGRYLAEKERRYNLDIMPYGSKFVYDNKDDEEDQRRADILATRIANLKEVTAIGVDRQDPLYAMKEIKQLAVQWEVIPPEMADRDVPKAMGAIIKEISSDDLWVVTSEFKEYRVYPILTSEKDKSDAEFVHNYLHHVYTLNGAGNRSVEVDHQIPEEVKL